MEKSRHNLTTQISHVDGLHCFKEADPNCSRCQGHGILDAGHDFGYIPIRCDVCMTDEALDKRLGVKE